MIATNVILHNRNQHYLNDLNRGLKLFYAGVLLSLSPYISRTVVSISSVLSFEKNFTINTIIY